MVEDEKEEQGVVGCIPKIKFAVISIFTSIAFLLWDQASRLRNRNGWTRKRKVFRKILTPYDWLVEDVENIIPRNKRKM